MAVAWLVAALAGAQRLPLRCWGVRDGLAAPAILSILQDARGYLWVGTVEGLSRFDGYEFRNFGVADGLGHPVVNDMAEDDAGDLWVATNGAGVVHVGGDPTAGGGTPLASVFVGSGRDDDAVNALTWRREELWVATDGGLFRSRRTATGLAPFRRVLARKPLGTSWETALRDSRDRLWLGVSGALLEIDGKAVRRHPHPEGAAAMSVTALDERPDRALLVTAHDGVYTFEPAAAPRLAWRRLSVELAPQQTLFDLAQGSAGEIWIASRHGLIRWHDGEQQTFTEAHGLPNASIRSLARDRDGNLWIGTEAGGLCRLAPRGIVNYTVSEGLPAPDVVRVVETLEGRILALSSYSGAAEIREVDARPLRGSQSPPWNAIGHRLLQDRSGNWWAGTGAWFEGRKGAVYRMPAGPLPGFTRAVMASGHNNLPDDPAGSLPGEMLEAADGSLWFVVFGRGLLRRLPDGESFEPVVSEGHVGSFLPEANGDLWYTTYNDFRLRRDGKTWVLPWPARALRGSATALLRDRKDRLWVGFLQLGLGRALDAPDGPPRIQRMTIADGLLSDAIYALAEDPRGRIWIGTGRGVQILDPESGRLRRLTMADGLAGDRIHHLHLDRRGRMWVATATGLSRVDLTDETTMTRPPPVYLTRVRAGGSEQPISPYGLPRLAGLRLVEPRNDLLVEFVGVSFAREGELRYQYRLVGAGDRWSEPAAERVVNFARLAAGRYRLEVRAVNEEGVVSQRPAEVVLRVLPPTWRRGWFLALIAAALAAVVVWLHRQRVARLLALERVRGQIAADLHDDVGAGLSEIAILSEAARGRDRPLADATLARVAEHARSLRQALADTVWAVDPRRDRADELVRRMREVTHNLLRADEIEVAFTAPPAERLERVALAPDQRRDLLLLFQELIHNTARHAAADRVEVELALSRGALRLTVRDDGRGFDPSAVVAGHGLVSMRARAERLGGRFQLHTCPGRGCTAELFVPLRS